MLIITYKGGTTIPVEAEVVRPDQLAENSVAEIEKLPVQHGNQSVPLAEFFTVKGDPAKTDVHLEGDWGRVKWVGAGMKRGRITAHGDVGMHLGSEMEGGEIVVQGNAGDWAGGEMVGGSIHIHGNAGHLVGAGYRGSRLGMKGGVILVNGNAGNEIGGGMRRGFIAVGGDTGDFAGVSVIAGTIFIFGDPGIRIGAGMKRGTVALLGDGHDFRPVPGFKYSCRYTPNFMALHKRVLEERRFPHDNAAFSGTFSRYCGDLVALGKGEILVRSS